MIGQIEEHVRAYYSALHIAHVKTYYWAKIDEMIAEEWDKETRKIGFG